MSDTKIELRASERGFMHGSFADANGERCSLQESSAWAEEGMIWLGINEPEPKYFSPYHARTWEIKHEFPHGWSVIPMPPGDGKPGNPGAMLSGRMHLTQSQVKALLPALQHFAEHGRLPA